MIMGRMNTTNKMYYQRNPLEEPKRNRKWHSKYHILWNCITHQTFSRLKNFPLKNILAQHQNFLNNSIGNKITINGKTSFRHNKTDRVNSQGREDINQNILEWPTTNDTQETGKGEF